MHQPPSTLTASPRGWVKSPPPVETRDRLAAGDPLQRGLGAGESPPPAPRREGGDVVVHRQRQRRGAAVAGKLAVDGGDLADRRPHPAQLASAPAASDSLPGAVPRTTRRPRCRRGRGRRRARAAPARSRQPTRPAPPPGELSSRRVASSCDEHLDRCGLDPVPIMDFAGPEMVLLAASLCDDLGDVRLQPLLPDLDGERRDRRPVDAADRSRARARQHQVQRHRPRPPRDLPLAARAAAQPPRARRRNRALALTIGQGQRVRPDVGRARTSRRSSSRSGAGRCSGCTRNFGHATSTRRR